MGKMSQVRLHQGAERTKFTVCSLALASCMVLGLLADVTHRGSSVQLVRRSYPVTRPAYGRNVLQPSRHQTDGDSSSRPVNQSLMSAQPSSSTIIMPIISSGELVSSNNTDSPSWRIESRGGVRLSTGALEGRVHIVLPAGIPPPDHDPQSVVLINSSPIPASAKSLGGVFSSGFFRTTSHSLARARTLLVQFGCVTNNSRSESWYGSVLLHTVASSFAHGMRTSAELPLPQLNGTDCEAAGGFDRVRFLSVACDRWGHIAGQPDCDPEHKPAEVTIGIQETYLSSKPARGGDCAPASLLFNTGWSCELEPSCPLSSLYSNVYLPPSGLYTEARELAKASREDVPLVPEMQMGTDQGIKCKEMLESVYVGCLLSRGIKTHKAVHAGVYVPYDVNCSKDSQYEYVVVKQGGIRFPLPHRGDRAVGLKTNESIEEQRTVLKAMFYEQIQEIFALEYLAPHPGIPQQFGACIDTRSMVATSVQKAAQIRLSTKEDLKAVCRRKLSPSACAFSIVNSTASLFRYLTNGS